MTPDIERLAKEAGLADDLGRPLPAYPRRLAKFAALIAEECAKECEKEADFHEEMAHGQAAYASDGCAVAIRSKFPTPTDATK